LGKNNDHKVNIKARIDRHSRMIKDNISMQNKVFSVLRKNNLGYKIVIGLMIFAMPVYPMFAWIINNTSELDFYRWYIDESSILFSYDEDSTPILSDWTIDESEGDFLADTTLLNEDRNYDWTNEVRQYKVKPWDSISVIASKFKVSKDTIYDFNGFSKNHIIKPGEDLKIPATSWISYKVKSGDSLLAIAKKYKIDSDKILEFNNFDKNKKLKVWEEIFLPWAKKIYVAPKKTYTNSSYTKKTYSKKTNYVASQYTSSKWVYKLKWRKPFSWAWGNCTYYVASYKNVNWRWNANQWLRNAAKKGHKVVYGRAASYAKPWAIVVLEGRWYNLRYGHVAIVMEVKKNYMIVSEMNYRRINQVTYRKVPLNSRNITGYIYVWD